MFWALICALAAAAPKESTGPGSLFFQNAFSTCHALVAAGRDLELDPVTGVWRDRGPAGQLVPDEGHVLGLPAKGFRVKDLAFKV